MNLLIPRFAAAALVAVLASCGSANFSAPPPSTATAAENTLGDAVFQDVNSYRRSRGAPPLQRHPGLDRLARQHAEFLRANQAKFGNHGLSHFGFDQRALAAQRRYNISSIGENLAAASSSGGSSAATTVKLWVNSPSHDHNIRNSWATSGVGVAIADDGKAFVTQIFGTQVSSSHSAALDPFRQH